MWGLQGVHAGKPYDEDLNFQQITTAQQSTYIPSKNNVSISKIDQNNSDKNVSTKIEPMPELKQGNPKGLNSDIAFKVDQHFEEVMDTIAINPLLYPL